MFHTITVLRRSRSPVVTIPRLFLLAPETTTAGGSHGEGSPGRVGFGRQGRWRFPGIIGLRNVGSTWWMGLEKNRKNVFVLPELKESIPLASTFLKSTRVSEVMPDIGFIWLYIVITFQINNDKHCFFLWGPQFLCPMGHNPLVHGRPPMTAWAARMLGSSSASPPTCPTRTPCHGECVERPGTAVWRMEICWPKMTKIFKHREEMRCLIEQIMKGWTILSKTRHKTIEIWWARAKQSSYLWWLCGLNKKWGLQNRSGDRTNRNRDTQQQIMVNTIKHKIIGLNYMVMVMSRFGG